MVAGQVSENAVFPLYKDMIGYYSYSKHPRIRTTIF